MTHSSWSANAGNVVEHRAVGQRRAGPAATAGAVAAGAVGVHLGAERERPGLLRRGLVERQREDQHPDRGEREDGHGPERDLLPSARAPRCRRGRSRVVRAAPARVRPPVWRRPLRPARSRRTWWRAQVHHPTSSPPRPIAARRARLRWRRCSGTSVNAASAASRANKVPAGPAASPLYAGAIDPHQAGERSSASST